MTLYLLIVRNRLTTNEKAALDTTVDLTKNYFKVKADFDLDVKFLDTDLDTKHKDFGIKVAGINAAGLDGIKEQLRGLKQIPNYTYHVVCYVYHQPEWNLPNLIPCAWTYPNNLAGAAFVEIPSLFLSSGLHIFSHELIHAMHRLAWFKWIATNDTMDRYDQDTDVFSTTGNRARNLAELQPHFGRISQPPPIPWLEQIKQAALKIADILINMNNRKIKLWAEAIQAREGWFPGSRSQRNNNPGNLKYTIFIATLGATGKDDKGFAVFPSYAKGFGALMEFLTLAAQNKLRPYRLFPDGTPRPPMTILDFFHVYAPPGDDNDPNSYGLFAASRIGVSPQTLIKDLL